jgi:hypothetical protein
MASKIQQSMKPYLAENMHPTEKNGFHTIPRRKVLYLDDGFKLMHVVGETPIYDTSVEQSLMHRTVKWSVHS